MKHEKEILPVSLTRKFDYNVKLLYKYHNLSKQLNDLAKEKEAQLGINVTTDSDEVRGMIITFCEFIKAPIKNEGEITHLSEVDELVIFDYPELSDDEKLKLTTLFCIIYSYCRNEYGMYFIRNSPLFSESGQSDKSDEEKLKEFHKLLYNFLKLKDKDVHDYDTKHLNEAYECLNSLYNSMLIYRSDYKSIEIKIKTKQLPKENNQVTIKSPLLTKSIIEQYLNNLINIAGLNHTGYINAIYYNGRDIENLDIDVIKNEMDNLKNLKEIRHGQTSRRVEFKSFLVKIIHKYLKDEGLTLGGKLHSEYDYNYKMIAYDFMSRFCLIDSELLLSHKNVHERTKYIDWLRTKTNNSFDPTTIVHKV
ncbi:hypothetical protein ACR78Z_12185 [Sphingobacterium thalpophilum]|uniref:hypothetical protein n=1 Tax=Sphingobacterium thalpophilum TaxID=259 RepID=UPI003DA2AA81